MMEDKLLLEHVCAVHLISSSSFFPTHSPTLMLSCFLDFQYPVMSVCITLIDFNHFILFPAAVVRNVSPKSPHDFKGCLCLWTHKGLSKTRLYHFLFMSVCSSSPCSFSSGHCTSKHTLCKHTLFVSDHFTRLPNIFLIAFSCIS